MYYIVLKTLDSAAKAAEVVAMAFKIQGRKVPNFTISSGGWVGVETSNQEVALAFIAALVALRAELLATEDAEMAKSWVFED